MGYTQEIDAVQRWLYGTARLPSYRLEAAPPKLARPVVVWEAPSRQTARNLSRWQYVKKVTQFGKIYVADLAQLLKYQDLLEKDLEERVNQLPVFDTEGQAGVVVGQLRDVQLIFDHTESTLDIQLRVSYEATYSRTREIAPPPTDVYTRIVRGT